MLTYKIYDNSIKIHIPFELKDSFKSTFKTAQYTNEAGYWKINAGAESKLKQWINASKSVVKTLDERDNDELSETELRELQAGILDIRTDIAKEAQLTDSAVSTCELLANAKKEFSHVTAELKAEKEKARTASSEAQSVLKEVCDLNAVLAAQQTMIRNCGKKLSKYKVMFNEAQSIICENKKSLMSAGFRSAGIDTLAYCNFNRPDRDNPSEVDMTEILKLTKIED